MKLFTENSYLVISEITNLKKYQISQLEYYGYGLKDDVFIKFCENIGDDLNIVITYLKEEEIYFEVTSEIDHILSESLEKEQEVSKLFDYAGNIKMNFKEDEPFKDFEFFLSTLPRKLKDHQIKSAYHFYSLGNGANFSVPGSGKTSTILSVYEKLRTEGRCNVLFIVGPPSSFQPWKNEFQETLGRIPDALILSGGSKKNRISEYYQSIKYAYELYLITFHTLLNDYHEIMKFFSQRDINAFLVVDEAHYIKQIGGSWSTALLQVGNHAAFRGVLTGTPIPKSYRDIFNLFDFLWYDQSPLKQEDKIKIDIWEKNNNHEMVKELLHEKIGPLFYRVKKIDLNLIPAKFHEPIVVKMNPTEASIYNYIKAKFHELAQEDFFRNEELLAKLWRGRMIRLRQAASYPKLMLSAIDGYSEKLLDSSELELKIKNYDHQELPAKLEALLKLVLNLRRDKMKVLIWSNFIGTLELIKKQFLNLGENCEIIYGKTPVRKENTRSINEEKTREDIRDEFVDPESGMDILIANPAACAESISLHKTCFHSVYYDLSYNCAQYIQSLDRIHRVGGSEIHEANYYFLQYESSVDQDIKRNLELKAKKMYDVIEQDYNVYDLDLFNELDEDDVAAYRRLFVNK